MNRKASHPSALHRLYQWFQQNQGQAFIDEEQQVIQTQLEMMFGYYLLQIGNYPHINCDETACKVKNHIVLGREAWAEQPQLLAHPQELPFDSESLDVVILPHTLEFEQQPHQILREVDRCLLPEGYVIITAFNPTGLWLPWRLLAGWSKRLPWHGRYLSKSRLRDWMQLLGFEVEQVQHFFYQAPFWSKVARRFGWLDFLLRRYLSWSGAGYMLVAKKRVSTLTQVKPRWMLKTRPLLGLGLSESIRLHRDKNKWQKQ
jgi:SAM-dependent methyltransferase